MKEKMNERTKRERERERRELDWIEGRIRLGVKVEKEGRGRRKEIGREGEETHGWLFCLFVQRGSHLP